MNTRTIVLGVAILILAVLAYYVGTNRAAVVGNDATAGDASAKIAASEAYDPLMAGTWKSTDDEKFTREFTADGAVTDRYEGDASATMAGTYVAVNPLEDGPAGVPAESLTGSTIIKISWADGETMYFGVSSLTADSLVLVNLSGRGNILSFAKVQ